MLQWLSHQAANFYDEGIKNLVVRYDKCLNIGGNYVEKYRRLKCRLLRKNKIVTIFLLVFLYLKTVLPLKTHLVYRENSTR